MPSEADKAASPPMSRDASGQVYLRLVRDDAVEIIERLRETHADTMGRAYMIHLDRLASRLGSKWDTKRDLVFEHLKTSFERKFPEPNWCIRLNDDSFLAVLLTLGEHKGALSAAELWYATGHFFVGDVSAEPPPLYEAVADDVDRMRLIPIDLATYFDRGETRPPRPGVAAPLSGDADADARHPASVGVMITLGGRPAAGGGLINAGGWTLKIVSTAEPVFEMKKQALIGHRLAPQVLETTTKMSLDARAIANMDWGDRELIDIANVEEGIKCLRTRTAEDRRVVMVVPAAFSTYASAKARTRLTTLVTAGAREMGLKVLFEIRHLNGVPMGRISEIVALLKPHGMGVLGHVTAESRAVATLKGCGLAGVCLDFEGLRHDDDALLAWLAPLAAASRAATGACMILGLNTLHQMSVARQAGVSHATIKAPVP